MAASMRYPQSFFTSAFVLIAIAAAGVAVSDRGAVALADVLPSLILTTALLSIASCTLLTAIFNRTRERSLCALIVMFLTLSAVEISILVTVPLPSSQVALIDAGANAAPYLSLFALLLFPFCAVWYAVESRASILVTPETAHRLYRIGLPVAIVAVAAAVGLLAAFAAHLPVLVHGADRSGFQHSPLSYVQVGANVAAVAFIFRFTAPHQRRGLNLAVLLALIASTGASIVVLSAHYRYGYASIVARTLIMLSATFVLIAAVRNLVERLTDGLRVEADALRTQATVYEQNAAVEASLVKSRFVAMVSHELRTPLGGIIGMAELLQRSQLDERQRSWVQAVRASADTLLRIVNDLLDFSRVESGNVELEDLPFDLVQAVEDVTALFREQARARGVQMLSYIDPALPRTIAGDETRVKQVLQNLLNNAVRFTERGSIRVDVSRETTERGDVVRWDVHDTGVGIGASARDRIFRAFTQEDASTARRFGGTGLGLTIARHLAELMGGSLTLQSELGAGSTFTFKLPFRPVARRSPVDALLRDTRVLIVESNDAVRPLLQRYVRGWEMRCTAIAGAAELGGLERESHRGYDVLLFGPGVEEIEAVAMAETKKHHPSIAQADTILVRENESSAGVGRGSFDARVVGPLRQSTLCDTIVRLRRHGIAERTAPPMAGIAARRARTERILVAEDNEVNQELLVAQLAHLGFTADVVADGEAALAAVDAGSYDLVFMDCQMPGLDGFEAARRIRARGDRRGTMPIIAVTANVMPGYREICLGAGMDDYLAKPALIAPLAAIVDRWLPPPAAESVPATAPASDEGARARLLEIFKGDEARVDELIARAMNALVTASLDLRGLLDARSPDAARAAHKAKGIALEIGYAGVAAEARAIEDAVLAGAWSRAEKLHHTFVASLERCVTDRDRMAT
jgi:signal transduction histidine kinase/CheY-like chemotaxis protein